MQFKHKLIYFALGCAFVVIGQVLLSVVVPKVTAQGKKESVEFDTITCRSLKIVDAKGKIRAQLEVDIIGIDVIQILNPAGIPVCKIGSAIGGGGSVIVAGDNGIARASMLVWPRGTGGLNVMNKYGTISVGIGAGENTNNGHIEIYSNNFKLRSKIWSDANGGRADFCNNNDKQSAAICVDEYGNGAVGTWDKNGYRLR